MHSAQNGTPAEFHILFRNVLRRVNFLNHFHCGGDLRDDAADLVADAGSVRTVGSHVRWHEWDRYSARQDQRVPMGGFTGRIIYEGDFEPSWPWLAFGDLVHVGKGATFGLGRFEIEVLSGANGGFSPLSSSASRPGNSSFLPVIGSKRTKSALVTTA